jgi:hypothetical protein
LGKDIIYSLLEKGIQAEHPLMVAQLKSLKCHLPVALEMSPQFL